MYEWGRLEQAGELGRQVQQDLEAQMEGLGSDLDRAIYLGKAVEAWG
jgi:hypothetical protein